jgi:hypothetical protein
MNKQRKRYKPVTVRVVDGQYKTWWMRSELKELLGRSESETGQPSRPMSEATFKRRLALLEEYCPESEHRLYTRKFPDFTKWALVTIESWLCEANYNMIAIQQKLENGLPTDEYFRNSKNST